MSCYRRPQDRTQGPEGSTFHASSGRLNWCLQYCQQEGAAFFTAGRGQEGGDSTGDAGVSAADLSCREALPSILLFLGRGDPPQTQFSTEKAQRRRQRRKQHRKALRHLSRLSGDLEQSQMSLCVPQDVFSVLFLRQGLM